MHNLSRRAAWVVLAVSPFALPIDPARAQDPAPAPAAPPAAPVAEPAPAPQPVTVEVAVSTPAPPAPAAAAAEPEAAPALTFALFADAYMGLQTSGSGTVATLSGHRAWTGQGSTRLSENGFSLSWLGLDANYDGGWFAVTGSLRFGSATPLFHGASDFAFGVDNITQGFVTWRPIERLDLDLGMFSTPFGAEVAESWKNLNYTRGALYYYGQPFWHTGLRAKYRISDEVSVTGLLVNGVNNVSETQQNDGLDQSPTIGAQVGITPSDTLSLAAGGLVALDGEENDDGGFDTFLDLVAVLSLDPITVVFNADYVLTQAALGGADDRSFFGLSGAIGYAFTNNFGVAGRLEFLSDSFAGGVGGDDPFDGSDATSWSLFTATLTLDYKPLPETPNLIIRWDNRFEKSNQDVFGDSISDALDPGDDTFKDNWFQSVIGVVVTTSP
jgi:putative OmpL-like beta-barrel porin-2